MLSAVTVVHDDLKLREPPAECFLCKSCLGRLVSSQQEDSGQDTGLTRLLVFTADALSLAFSLLFA